MLIPLITPQDGEVLNLAQMVRLHVVRSDDDPKGGEIELFLADGTKRVYTGDAARFVNIEVHFALNTYRQMQIASQSSILAPDGNKPGMIM